MAQEYRRKNYFIDKRFQTRFIVLFCSVVVISSVLLIGLLFFSLQDSNTVAIENTKVTVKQTADFILPITVQTVTVVSIFSGLAIIVLSLLTSHKIAGPLYRLILDVDKVKKGDLSADFRIRGNDQLQNLAKGLKEMCSFLKKNRKDLNADYEELRDYLHVKNYNLSSQDEGDIKKLIENLGEKINQFKS